MHLLREVTSPIYILHSQVLLHLLANHTSSVTEPDCFELASIKATFLTQKSIVEMAPQRIEWWAIALLCHNARAHSCCHYGAINDCRLPIIESQPPIASSRELDTILKEKKVCTQKKMVWNEQTQFKDQINTSKSPHQIFMSIKFYFCDCFELSLSRAGEDKFKSHPCLFQPGFQGLLSQPVLCTSQIRS